MNMKKALKHDIEVAGKTIPTMILVGLFLVGGGSAALLTSFGTVDGTANVDQAVTVSGPTTVSYADGTLTAGTTTVDPFTVTNNNQQTAVDYQLSLQREALAESGDETASNGNLNGVSTGIYDVTQSTTASTSDVEVTKGFDTSENEVTFTINYTGDVQTGQLHIDRDNDGTNEYHLGLYSTGYNPKTTVVTDEENGAVTSWVLNEAGDDFTQGQVEGVSASVDSNGVITVSIDADTLGQNFRYGVGVNSGGADYAPGVEDASVGASTVSNSWDTVHPGEEVVTGSGDTDQTVDAGSSRSYVMVNEWAINLDPSYDYNVTAQVNPDYDQERQVEPTTG